MDGHFITILGFLVIGLGSWISFRGQVVLRKADAEKAKNERKRESVEISEKFLEVMTALGAAKQEQGKKLTDDKIRLIENDLVKWADDFDQARPQKQKLFDSANLAVTQKEIQASAQCRPLFEFAMRFVEESLRAYAKRTGYDIKIELPALPENFYARDSTRRVIIFKGGKSTWDFCAQGVPPITRNSKPRLMINFNSHDVTGGLYITPDFTRGKVEISSADSLPTPDPTAFNMEGELSDYENIIKGLMQKLIEAQLIQAR